MKNGDAVGITREALGSLRAIAERGLGSMWNSEHGFYCHRLVERGRGRLVQEGLSPRYTVMCLLGLIEQQRLGSKSVLDLGPVVDSLFQWATTDAEIGDTGLVLWALSLAQDSRARILLDKIHRAGDEILDPGAPFPSMEMGWLQAGLARSLEIDSGRQETEELARKLAMKLIGNQNPDTGLFSFSARIRRKNFIQQRVDSTLGSFASQVYPLVGLSFIALQCGDDARFGESVAACAGALVELQGPQGQWWWIYNVETGEPVIRYPVYTVHQDSMAPMAFLAAGSAASEPSRYLDSIQAGIDWLWNRPELSTEELVESDRGLIRRAVQRDLPNATGRLGLGRAELRRMTPAAWFRLADQRPFGAGFVCRECRPYHLGWILLADAWAASLNATE